MISVMSNPPKMTPEERDIHTVKNEYTDEMKIALMQDHALTECFRKHITGKMNELIAKFPSMKDLTENPVLEKNGFSKIIENEKQD